jgi:glucose/arabinose dehydrogenase
MTRSPSPLFSACALLVTTLAAGCQVQPPLVPPAPKGTVTPVEYDTIQQAATLSGFSDQLVFSGRTSPIAVRFASNGKIFVAEENGRIYFYDSLTDTTATLFADLRGQVNSYWDRGMLGFTLDPNYATNGHVYVLYTHDTATNAENNQSAANRNATDNCPSPPGGTSQGCITYGVLARITDPGTGYPITARLDLITEWPQQFPSHAIGALNFGPDGFLYATGGDGASFNATDWGQFGIPVNPLGDPPGGVGGSMSSGTSRGGSSRSQSFRRSSGENVTLNGSVIRINPVTGAGATGNPNLSHADVDARRIIAIGLRNPYRFTFHPTTGDIWIGDVGANAWEEINRLPAPLTATPMKNFGWPCYEGNGRFAAWDNLDNSICENLYAGGSSAHAAPYHAYAHGQPVYTGDACGTGSSAITGLAFYPQAGGNYPTQYRNALFFADLTRDCIFVVRPNLTTGLPDMATRTNFVSGALNPSDLQIGPNNDLFYVDYGGSGGNGTPTAGTGGVRRIRYAAPTAIASANPTSGFAPLVVQFTGSMSTPGLTGDTLTYAWDLDGDGAYDDSTAINPSHTYTTSGDVVTRLKVTDQRGGFGESQPITINVGTTTEPPVPVIDTPSATLTWKVGDQISFSGHATDTEDGTIPASGLSWELVMMHCPGTCHEHLLQTFDEVASGTFPAPDHEYPSHLRLRLTATDSHGRIGTTIVELQAQTVSITLQAAPTTSPTLQLTFSQEQANTPFTRTAIVGSFMTLSAPQQTRGNTLYNFQSWAHGGTESQTVTIPATPTTYTATFVGTPVTWQSQDVGAVASAGSWTLNGGTHTVAGNGADIWNAADEFRFVYQQLSGDGTITAKVSSFTNNAGNANGKAGVMIRESLNANSPHAMAAMPPQTTITLVKHVKRLSAGATSAAQTGPSPTFPAWVRVVRAGNTLRAYHSTDGTTFTELGTVTTITSMTGPVFVGLAVSSHVDGVNATAVFDGVTVTTPAPPTAPTGLTASGGANQAVLNWTDTSNNETGFKIERKLASDPDTSFAQVGTAAVNATTFTSTSLLAGSYTFRVRASGSPTDSGYSNTASATVTDPPPPAAPSNLVAGDGVNQSVLTWTDTSSTETGFEIERKLQGELDTSYAQVGTTSANVATFTNTSVPAGVYTYRVKATNGSGDSAPSNPDDATITDPQPPAAPTSLTATGGGAQAVLAWTDNANNETGFEIERKVAADPDTSFAQVGTAGVNATGFTNTSVPAGTYTYRVRATNAVGDSEYSNTADATVTVPSGPTAPTNLSSTTASGNSVTLTWTDTSSNETGFRVERKVGPTGSYASLATKAANVVTHTDAGPLAANTYYYRVVATGSPESAPSNEVVVVINNPVADSYVREGTNAGINYGTETFIKIKLNTTVSNNRRGYVRFSLANVGATVTSAKLRLYGLATTNTKNVGVHAVSNTTWGETTITFSNAPAMTTPAIQTRPVTTTAAYVEWDVTAYVQSQRTANATTVSLGLLTTSSFPDTETNINSRENIANKPILIISSKP